MTPSRISVRQGLFLLAISSALLSFHWVFYISIEIPHKDEIRYADYVYSLSQYNIFGLNFGDTHTEPARSFSNAPLYPLVLSSITSENTETSLACYLEQSARIDCLNGNASCGPPAGNAESCPHQLEPLILTNYVLAGISLILTGLIGFRLFKLPAYLYLTPVFVFLSFTLTDYGQRILVTNLVMPLFLGLQFSVLLWFEQRQIRYGILAGVLLALLTLTRPEYLYLLPFCLLCGLLIAIKSPRSRQSIVCFVLGFILTISPWLWRNHELSSQWQLVDNRYGAFILAQRLAYNDMSTKEWLTSFVFWFPDVGDNIAKNVFPPYLTDRHEAGAQNSYNEIAKQLYAESANHNHPMQWLLGQMFSQPVMHTLTTLSFSWRGLFPGKWWAIGGFFTYLLLLYRELKNRRFALLWISALPFYMLLLRAGVSLNVARYNLPLIALYALGWTHLVLPTRYKSKLNHQT